MSNLLLETRRLITAIKSPTWSFKLQHLQRSHSLIAISDLAELDTIAARHPGSLAIVELTGPDIAKTCEKAIRLVNNPHQLCMVAIGNRELMDWAPLIRTAGFTASICSVFQAPRIERLVEKHFSAKRKTEVSLEKSFEINLPWQTINK